MEYKLIRKKIKNIHLRVKEPSGEVVVSAPMRCPKTYIDEFVQSKEAWIMKQQVQIRQRMQQADYEKQRNPEPSREDLELLKLRILRLARKWEPIMGVHCLKWSVRSMHTRWGSCTPVRGTIRMNAALAYKDDELLEYVIVHELCHLLEASHNHRFHALMNSFMPDYQERKRRLNNTN